MAVLAEEPAAERRPGIVGCDLNATLGAQLTTDLHPLIDHRRDQILVLNLGPVERRAETCLVSISCRYIFPSAPSPSSEVHRRASLVLRAL